MSKHISEKKRDLARERNFRDVYGLTAKIEVTNFNDEQWNWDMVILNFTDTSGKKYGLIEHFKDADDNGTKHAIFEWEDRQGTFHQEKYPTFLEAEQELVKLMRRRLEGKD